MQTAISTIAGPREVARERIFCAEHRLTLEVIDTRKEDFLPGRDVDEHSLIFHTTNFSGNKNASVIYFKLYCQPKHPGELWVTAMCFEVATSYLRDRLGIDPEGFGRYDSLAWEGSAGDGELAA